MNTWLNALTLPEQKPKKKYKLKNPGICGIKGCSKPRRISQSGHVYTYCQEHDNERARRDYENEKKRKMAASGVADYSIHI